MVTDPNKPTDLPNEEVTDLNKPTDLLENEDPVALEGGRGSGLESYKNDSA